MTDTERKEVEELALILFKTDYPRTSPDDVKEEDKEIYKLQAIDAVRAGYTKRPQDNNTTCPSREEFAKELFNSLGGCIIKETTGHTIYDRWVCAKFGKDNSGMVNGSLFPLADIQRKCNIGLSTALKVRDYLYERFSQQPPKEPCGHDWQYNSDIKGVAQCSKCDEYQLPKERKVSLEELRSIKGMAVELSTDGEWYLTQGSAKAILSLINATEE